MRCLAATPRSLFILLLRTLLAVNPTRRPALKRKIAQAVHLPPETLVLNPAVLAEIDAAKQAGRPVYLASGADELALLRTGRVRRRGWMSRLRRSNQSRGSHQGNRPHVEIRPRTVRLHWQRNAGSTRVGGGPTCHRCRPFAKARTPGPNPGQRGETPARTRRFTHRIPSRHAPTPMGKEPAGLRSSRCCTRHPHGVHCRGGNSGTGAFRMYLGHLHSERLAGPSR